MLYFLSATGRTLWHGSSMETRKDLKISTCGFVEGVCAGVDADGFEDMVPPDSGGSRSSGLGVTAALFRSGRELSGAGVARASRALSDTAVVSEAHVFVCGQFGVLSWSGWPLRGMSDRL